MLSERRTKILTKGNFTNVKIGPPRFKGVNAYIIRFYEELERKKELETQVVAAVHRIDIICFQIVQY